VGVNQYHALIDTLWPLAVSENWQNRVT